MNGLVKEGSIGEVLFKSQIITEHELRAALEAQKVSGCRVGEALVRMGVVTQEDIDWALANQLNIPYVRLKKENIDPAAVEKVPGQLARRHSLCPVVLSGSELSVAMADPLDKEAIEELSRVSGCHVNISVGLIREIREMHETLYGPDVTQPELGFSSGHFSASVLGAINADLTGAMLLNHLLLRVVQKKLTGIALQPLGDQVRVLARSGHKSAELGRIAITHYARLTERIRRLSNLPSEGEGAASGVLKFLWQGKKIPFQALLMAGDGGDYVTLRLHAVAPQLSTMDDLGLTPRQRDDLGALTAAREGLILFAGRSAEERSRLIDLFIDSCDHAGRTVLLIGDRLGRGRTRFPRLSSVRCCVDDSAAVIGAALEHDPDTLVIEDVTDLPTFIAASKAVMRGKLVVAGMSQASKTEVLKQLIYLIQKNFLIPTHIRGVVSSRCALLLCPECKERYVPAPEELAALRLGGGDRNYYRPAGCPACDQTGYRGKKYLLDVIRFDKDLLEALEMIRNSDEVVRYLRDTGFRGIAEEGAELLERGEIAPGEYVASIIL
ncbi:Flp pilus assembly complex ATPase component TadA [Geomonas sp. Red69]|uniref:ATPase, T2SS/T4P/T4SS family n=1 Tax=Geomonas diazotrophica TaxID=2843197 RepID=UPI001C10B3FD|nr:MULTISPECIES: ATPase, T2SS/T4P/T4SS family [Geomonas]MBU5635318.1 Flp pilus assembly complex ATPase component TadA [Geomonas diazotrophica]QXE86765.1 Flp pilus assembly complex ATPase component TadA [Geomonas nitrogeniifigens]